MILAIVAFTRHGAALCRQLKDAFEAQGCTCTAAVSAKYAGDAGLPPLEGGLAAWTEQQFAAADGLIFIGACGIAVRAIAPFVRSKTTDPAVVVLDERGDYAISLLSGHIGGGNDLALDAAKIVGAVPVVTTATDRNGLFAVDSWATRQDLHICDMKLAKAVAAALLDGEPVGFCSDFPVEGSLPRGVSAADSGDLGICVTLDPDKAPFRRTLRLIPRWVTLGVGCRRNKEAGPIETLITESLREHHIAPEAVCQVCSIDLKAKEPGLLQVCRERRLPFHTFSSEALLSAPGEYTASAFVRQVTGVDNVCERSAVLGSQGGALLIHKQMRDGVTVAAAIEGRTIQFEN